LLNKEHAIAASSTGSYTNKAHASVNAVWISLEC